MTQKGDDILIGQTCYEVVFDGRQSLLRDRPDGPAPDGSSLAQVCKGPTVFRRSTRRYVKAHRATVVTTT